MNIKFQPILCLAFLCSFTFLGNAQLIVSDSAYKLAKHHVRKLKNEGTLIVYIPTQHRKIEILESMLTHAKKKKRVQKRLDEVLNETKELQTSIVHSYNQYFTFTKVYFMPDTMASKLFDGQRAYLFINKQFEIDPTIRLESDCYYISYIGNPKQVSSTGKKSLMIEQKDGSPLYAPFPFAIPFYSLLDAIDSETGYASIVERAVITQERKLNEFYIHKRRKDKWITKP